MSCVMTIIRVAALAALFLSTCGTSVALAQPAAGLFEDPPENMRLLCRPVMVRQAGAAVRLWRCPPRVTSALSPAARGVSNADPDSVYAANENWSQGEAARTGDMARGETRGSANGTRTADGGGATGIMGRGFTADGGTSSGGTSSGGTAVVVPVLAVAQVEAAGPPVRMAAAPARVAGPLVRVAASGADRPEGMEVLRRQQRGRPCRRRWPR